MKNMDKKQKDALNSLSPEHAAILKSMINKEVKNEVEFKIDDKFKNMEAAIEQTNQEIKKTSEEMRKTNASLNKLLELITGDQLAQTKGMLVEHREMYDDFMLCKHENCKGKLQVAYSTAKDLNQVDGVSLLKDIRFIIKAWKWIGSAIGVTSIMGLVSFLNSIFHWY